MPANGTSQPLLLFVYGTLRRGGGKEALLVGGRKVRDAAVAGTLHDLGDFPALVLGKTRRQVYGEIWACPAETLRALDTYEGVEAGLFDRVGIDVEDGRCWTYVAGPALEGRLSEATVIPSGRWSPTRPPAAP